MAFLSLATNCNNAPVGVLIQSGDLFAFDPKFASAQMLKVERPGAHEITDIELTRHRTNGTIIKVTDSTGAQYIAASFGRPQDIAAIKPVHWLPYSPDMPEGVINVIYSGLTIYESLRFSA